VDKPVEKYFSFFVVNRERERITSIKVSQKETEKHLYSGKVLPLETEVEILERKMR